MWRVTEVLRLLENNRKKYIKYVFIIQIIIITCIYIEYKVIELHVIITAKQYCIAVLYTDVHILKKNILKK